LHNKLWAEDRGERAEDRREKTELDIRKADDGFAAGRDLRRRVVAILRLAVLGVWAVYGYDDLSLLVRSRSRSQFGMGCSILEVIFQYQEPSIRFDAHYTRNGGESQVKSFATEDGEKRVGLGD